MKTIRLRHLLAVIAGLALAAATAPTQAQTFITDTYLNTFDTGGNPEPFANAGSVASWLYWYNTPGNNLAITNDVTMDAGGDPNSGSLLVSSPFGVEGTQNVFFGTFGNRWQYDFDFRADLSKYTNITFDIRVDTNMTVNGSGNFGNLGVGIINASYGYQQFGNVAIPANATNEWVRLTMTIDQTQANLASVPGITFAYNNYGGYPQFPMIFWIDNVALNLNPGPPPPPPTVALRKSGPSGVEITVDNNADQWQRDAIVNPAESVDNFWSGYGADPVTYSFTIADFPDPVAHEGFEAHLYLINRDTTDAFNETYGGADWNVPNIAIVSLQALDNGTFECQFQWKTNLPNSNPPDDPVHRPGYLYSPTALGTWSVSFTHNTNVTMSGPGGISTNFFLPEEAVLNNFTAGASVIQLGVHKNDNENDGHNNQISGTFSRFQKTGGGFQFDDSFDGPTLTNNHAWRRTRQTAVQHVPPGTAWSLNWTLPDSGFSPEWSPSLDAGATWTGLSGTPVQVGATKRIPVPGSLSDSNAFFRLQKRTFTRLQILLPGESNAPGTETGRTGTPTPQVPNVPFDVTVLAVDAEWYPISGIADVVSFTSTDEFAFLPDAGALVNGTRTAAMFFGNFGNFTVTVADDTDNTKLSDTSSVVSVPE